VRNREVVRIATRGIRIPDGGAGSSFAGIEGINFTIKRVLCQTLIGTKAAVIVTKKLF
jgi:hypothetical protein